MLDPFAGPGRFFKGNLHTHSTRSDGDAASRTPCARCTATPATISSP